MICGNHVEMIHELRYVEMIKELGYVEIVDELGYVESACLILLGGHVKHIYFVMRIIACWYG